MGCSSFPAHPLLSAQLSPARAPHVLGARERVPSSLSPLSRSFSLLSHTGADFRPPPSEPPPPLSLRRQIPRPSPFNFRPHQPLRARAPLPPGRRRVSPDAAHALLPRRPYPCTLASKSRRQSLSLPPSFSQNGKGKPSFLSSFSPLPQLQPLSCSAAAWPLAPSTAASSRSLTEPARAHDSKIRPSDPPPSPPNTSTPSPCFVPPTKTPIPLAAASQAPARPLLPNRHRLHYKTRAPSPSQLPSRSLPFPPTAPLPPPAAWLLAAVVARSSAERAQEAGEHEESTRSSAPPPSSCLPLFFPGRAHSVPRRPAVATPRHDSFRAADAVSSRR